MAGQRSSQNTLNVCQLTRYQQGHVCRNQHLRPAICYVSEYWNTRVWVNINTFFVLNVFIGNFVHVLLKHSGISLECGRPCSRHLCARDRTSIINTPCFTALFPERADSTFSGNIFLKSCGYYFLFLNYYCFCIIWSDTQQGESFWADLLEMKNFMICHFLKFSGNKFLFIIYTVQFNC